MSVTRTHNSQARPLLRGTLVSVGTTWYPSPGEGEEHRSCVIAVWCPHCRKHHYHGWNPADGPGVASHRAAHCHDEASPFYASGYFISPWRQSDPESAGHVVRPGRPIVRRVVPPAALDVPAAPGGCLLAPAPTPALTP